MVFLAPIKCELSEMIIIFKIKKKNFKTAFFWPEDKRIKTAIFGKNNYQHCVGSYVKYEGHHFSSGSHIFTLLATRNVL